jgi:hypothetical protein
MDHLDPMADPPAPLLRVRLRDQMRCLSQFSKGFIRLSEPRGFRHDDTTFPLPLVSAGPVPMKVGARCPP